MKKIKRNLLMMVLAIILSLGVSTAIPQAFGVVTVKAATVKINKKKVTLIKGQTTTLKITGTKAKVKWTSSKKAIATVSSKGKVTAKIKGKATITATVGKKKYKCAVTVETPKISKTKLTLPEGETATLKITGTTQKISWTSSNKSVATVTSKGKVITKGQGKAIVTATINGKKYKCTVTVESPKVKPTIQESLALNPGEVYQMKAQVHNATDIQGWCIDDENIAMVDENGVVTGLNSGSTYLHVTADGEVLDCKVTVRKLLFIKEKNITISEPYTMDIIGNHGDGKNTFQFKIEDDSILQCEWGESYYDSDWNGVIPLTIMPIKSGSTRIKISFYERNNSSNIYAIDYINVTVDLGGSELSNHLDELAEYIKSYGGTNSDGNKFIKGSISGSTVGIVYDNANNLFKFVFDDADAGSLLEMTITNANNNSNIIYIMAYRGMYGEAGVTFDISNYTQNTTLPFIVERTNLSNSECVNFANEFTKIAMKGFDILLKAKCGMSIQDIGFVSLQY